MKLTVLISSCGRRVQLMEAFRADARDLGIDLRIVGTDSQPLHSAAALRADAAFFVPRIQSDEFIPELLGICDREGVSMIIPTIDPGIDVYAKRGGALRERGIEVVVSNEAVVKITSDKLETRRWLDSIGIKTPWTMAMENVRRNFGSCQFPLVAKPIKGSGSVGIRLLANATELYDPVFDNGYIVQQFISGREYTVNMYFDLKEGQMHCAIPHRRIEVRSGEVAKGITVRHPLLEALAWKLGKALPGPRGSICFQAIEIPDGEIYVIEINARFGGGFPLAYRAGAKFTRWLMEEKLGLPSSASNQWKDNVLMIRYDEAVFVGD